VPVGLAIGAWAGFSATSGWIVVFPMLFVVSGRPLFECLLASLVIDWLNAVAAAVFYRRRGEPDLGVALRWVGASAPLALTGVAIAWVVLPRFDAVLGGVSGPIAIGMGLILLRRALGPRPGAADAGPAAVATVRGTALLRTGIAANGVMTGLIGQGGGLNVALLLMFLRGASTRVAVATALVFVAALLPIVIAAWSFVVGWTPGLWRVAAPFAVASAAGSALAAWQSARIPEQRLELVVAGCVLVAGAAATTERWLLGG
jgi:uncharacterized membrane protein YfcA